MVGPILIYFGCGFCIIESVHEPVKWVHSRHLLKREGMVKDLEAVFLFATEDRRIHDEWLATQDVLRKKPYEDIADKWHEGCAVAASGERAPLAAPA